MRHRAKRWQSCSQAALNSMYPDTSNDGTIRRIEGETGTADDNYKAPEGGGGVTDNIKVGNKEVTFGHGGRHLEGTNLSVSEVNQAIANGVINIGTYYPK